MPAHDAVAASTCLCAVLLILTSISLSFPWHVCSTYGSLARVHSSYICHYSHFPGAFYRCSPPPQTSVLLHSDCKKEGFRWPSSNAALCHCLGGDGPGSQSQVTWGGEGKLTRKCTSVVERVGEERNQCPYFVSVVERKASSHTPASQTQESKLASRKGTGSGEESGGLMSECMVLCKHESLMGRV